MDREQAITSFWNSFSIPAFINTNVPDEKDRPKAYITYESKRASLGYPVSIAVNIYARTTSEKRITDLVNEIEEKLPPHDTVPIWYDGGAVDYHWNTQMQAVPDIDPEIKHQTGVLMLEDRR